MTVILRFMLFVLFSVGLTSPAFAQTTIRVPQDVGTIQGAINAAGPGSTVVVSPGTYHEMLDFRGKAITVTGEGLPSSVVLDAELLGTAVRFQSGEGRGSILRNLTVQHGSPANLIFMPDKAAGGILIDHSSPTIQGVVLLDNAECAIGSYASSPLIEGSTISGTSHTTTAAWCPPSTLAPAYDPAQGSAIFLVGQAASGLETTISGNTIQGNTSEGALGATECPGIAIVDSAATLIANNYITGNIGQLSLGSGVSLQGTTSAAVLQNVVVSNLEDTNSPSFSPAAKAMEGGVNITDLAAGSVVTPTNNTVAYNRVIGERQQGTQAWLGFTGNVVLANNLFIGGDSLPPVDCSDIGTSVQEGTLTFLNNDVYAPGSSLLLVGDRCAGVPGANGNLAADPLFLNTDPSALNLQLGAASPAVDAGDNAAVGIGPLDFVSAPRIQNAKALPSAIIDMGAYERAGIAAPPPAADFSLRLTPTSVDLTQAPSATVELFLSPTSSLNAQVNSACSGLPSGVLCSFSPNAVNVSSGVPQTVQLTLSLTGSSAVGITGHSSREGGWPFALPALAAGLMPFAFRVRRKRLGTACGAACAAAGLLLGLAGCVHLNAISQESTLVVNAVASTGQHHSATLTVKAPL